jgi:hypothetical protein
MVHFEHFDHFDGAPPFKQFAFAKNAIMDENTAGLTILL